MRIVPIETLESLLRDWLKERMRDYYALDYIEPEVAQAVLRIWCAGESLGFPSVTLRRDVYGRCGARGSRRRARVVRLVSAVCR